ncbi:Gfo/Idh/MocA family protein [Pedobacter puniceum]|uniref:Gfo/Idh/MocA family oxidoreductase n=1 Tax=Pedobacter puniceum TaxID=2666136 RepID=A0A7K0FMB6_9SPHI|nr:Gfo/Idh/MocA family oxidoreductase [Pedobacter puniceum]MRX46167.1 gfo/Idh/MocA family oxidoreductase [Pedobacter puniceum]
MKHPYSRRKFIQMATIAGTSIGLSGALHPLMAKNINQKGKRVGIIGLDTSHVVAFTKTLNTEDSANTYLGYKVVAAYPHGSLDIKSSVDRIPGYTEDVKKLGVEIVSSIDELLKKVDVVLLETNDGRRHLEQALPVLKAGKRMFIDKPIAASLADAKAIFKASEKYKTPVFSSSSLRYVEGLDDVRNGKYGKVLGAETYSPALLEPTHPDFFWYGIHGIEMLFTIMGTGCKSVSRVHTEDTDHVVGIWEGNRIGTFRGIRAGKRDYGATVFGEHSIIELKNYKGYNPLLQKIIQFFDAGEVPVSMQETLEICAFIEAADESKRNNGASISIEAVFDKVK